MFQLPDGTVLIIGGYTTWPTPTAALSPDGKRVVLNAVDSDGRRNLFVYDLASGVRTSLLSSAPAKIASGGPLWTPDGNNILFTSARDVMGPKIILVPSDGSRHPRDSLTGNVGQMSPQGNLVAYTLPNDNGTFRTCYAPFSDAELEEKCGNAPVRAVCVS